MSDGGRVAVVVVHGIADQRAGQTVREIARLLCHGAAGAPRYVQGELRDVLVPVAKLEPGGVLAPGAAPGATSDGRAPHVSRRGPGAPSGFFQAQTSARGPGAASGDDLGLALNDYLLGRLALPERDALYESTRISLRRRADDRPVDLFELHWADLSRLREGGLPALYALYQLFFHLGILGADVVDQVALARGGGPGWSLLQRLHAWLAWLMKGPAALVQLAMLLLVLFGATALVSMAQQGFVLAVLFAVAAIGMSALAVLAWLRAATPAARWAKLLGLLAVALACAGAAAVALQAEHELPRMHFGAGVLLVAAVGGWLIQRYASVTDGVRVLGHGLVGATVIGLCVAGRARWPDATTQFEWMLTAAFNVGEWLLAAMLVVWAVYVGVQTVALGLGGWLGRDVDDAARRSLHTSRLAVVGSTALFAVLSLVLWSAPSESRARRGTSTRCRGWSSRSPSTGGKPAGSAAPDVEAPAWSLRGTVGGREEERARMATVDILLPGYPLRTARGSMGYASSTLVVADDGTRILVDCAGYSDRTQFFDTLRERGLETADIDVLVLTHLHFDHAVNARFFGGARVYVSRAEYDYALWSARQKPYGDPYVVDDPEGMLGRLKTELVDAETALAPGVSLLLSPGHTPGMLSVLAETARGRVAIVSDAAKSVSELISQQVFPSAACDQATAARSIQRFLDIADWIIPGHDRQVRVVDGKPCLEDVRNRPALTLFIY